MTRLLVLTGASGAGKTAIVEAISARHRPGLRSYHFDSIGVPLPERMIAEFGSGERWQAETTKRWVARLAGSHDGSAMILEGQMRPSVIRAALAEHPGLTAAIVLIDCSPDERRRRLAGPRNQPDLASAQMDNWAAYLRGQADALEIAVLDTSRLTVDQGADAVEVMLGELEAGR